MWEELCDCPEKISGSDPHHENEKLDVIWEIRNELSGAIWEMGDLFQQDSMGLTRNLVHRGQKKASMGSVKAELIVKIQMPLR